MLNEDVDSWSNAAFESVQIDAESQQDEHEKVVISKLTGRAGDQARTTLTVWGLSELGVSLELGGGWRVGNGDWRGAGLGHCGAGGATGVGLSLRRDVHGAVARLTPDEASSR